MPKPNKEDRKRSKSTDSINSESEDSGSERSEASQEKLFELLSVDSFDAASDYNEEEMERLVKMQFVNDGVGWEEISIGQKLQLFNKWSITILIGNIFTIFGSLFYLTQIFFPAKLIEVFIGFGCFFSWLSIIRYFQNTA